MKKCGGMNYTLCTKHFCVYMDLKNKTLLNIQRCFLLFLFSLTVKRRGIMSSVRRPDL